MIIGKTVDHRADIFAERVGGAAELASPERVAAYVEQLFPLSSDPKRQALQRARSADPSDSGSQGHHPPMDLSRLPSSPTTPAKSSPPTKSVAPAAKTLPPGPATLPPGQARLTDM